MTIDIIGAGIGGLTTAIALQQKGINVRLFEQTKEIKPVGAGIMLANNAMQVYEKLGIRKEIEKCGNPVSSMHITNAQLKSISTVDLKYFEIKNNVQNIAIHRGKLQQILVDKLNSDTLYLGSELVKIQKTDSGYTSTFKNSATVNSEIVLGADGLNSTVRNCLFSTNKIRTAYQICWRGVTDYSLPHQYKNELNEAWGKGDRFGFVQIAPDKVYWYALKSFRHDHLEYSVDRLNDYFEPYHGIIRDIIGKTPKNSIYTSLISDLKPIHDWYQGNVCLVGDAAHATTPNMGQGACQAIEDAYVLSECLGKFDLKKAFAEYQRLRMPKAHRIVNTSWALGKIAHWKNPFAIRMRNQLMRMTPHKFNRSRSKKIFQLEAL